MQQVFFQETEFLNSVIDYDHKVETENHLTPQGDDHDQ